MRGSASLLTLSLIIAAAVPARAADVRLASSDANGVTLRLDLDQWRIAPPGSDGRSEVSARGLRLLDTPGRPQLPYANALIAVPPGARLSVSVLSTTPETHEGVHVNIGPRSSLFGNGKTSDYTAKVEAVAPILDGSWPTSDASSGEPFEVRGQRIAPVALHPFHYDERTHRLIVYRSMTVRVAFVGRASAANTLPGGEDRYFEPVLKSAVINYDQGKAFRMARGRAIGTRLTPSRVGGMAARASVLAFDEGQPEVRVRIDSTGVWALGFDQLAAAGFPAAVADSEVSVHRHEYIGSQVPPYGTVEIPILVDDRNHNGVFDSGDRILFYMQDWATRSGATMAQRGWGDGDVVYATYLPGRAGLRFGTRDGTPSRTGLATLTSYPYTRRFEKNYAPFYSTPPDTNTDLFDWTQVALYYPRPDTLMFEASQLVPAQPAAMTIEMQGRVYEYHIMFGAIENQSGTITTVFDSTQATWTGNFVDTVRVGFAGSVLSEGLTNHLILWGKNQPLPPDPSTNSYTNVGLNWFSLTYWRRFQSIAGYLDCNSAGVAAPYEILATSFTSPADTRALDITDPVDPRLMTGAALEQNGATWNLRFQDSTGTQTRSYVVLDTPKSPPADHYSVVTRRFLSTQSPADYLLITPEAFLPAVQPLVNLRQSQGLNVLVAPLEAVNDEFNGGRHADWAIRRFLQFAYSQWGSRFVTLLGDAAVEDPMNIGGEANPDWLPSHRVQGPVGVLSGGSSVLEIDPGDNWYVWCLGNDPNCLNAAYYTQQAQWMSIGRLPVNSLAEAQAVVHKLVRYDTISPSDTWRSKMLLFSDDDYSDASSQVVSVSGYCVQDYERVFQELSATMKDVVINQAGLKRSEAALFNLGDWLVNEPIQIFPCGYPGCVPDTCRPDRNATIQRTRATVTPALFDSLNSGFLWWDYQGHANEQLLAHEEFYEDFNGGPTDPKNFANDGKPFFFTAFSCHTNNFGRRWENQYNASPGLGADLVTQGSDQGAIAAWASVGFEYVPSNGVSHLSVQLARSLFQNPPRDPDLGDRGARVVLGEAVEAALLGWVNSSDASPGERQVGVTYQLLGDPATRLSIGSPQALVVANGDTVSSDVAVRLGTPGDTLRLDADIVSNQQITTVSLSQSLDGKPATVILPASYQLSPSLGDTSTDQRQFHLTYRTSLTPNSYLYTIRDQDRDGTPGTFDVLLPFQCVLRSEGTPINDGDPVAPSANLSLLVISPSPIHPGTDLTLTLNGQPQPFDTTMVAADPTGREWILTWQHPAYPIDTYTLRLATSSAAECDHVFKVVVGGGELRLENALAFPNPFDEDPGTVFSFLAVSGSPVDVQLRIFTLTGRLIYSRTERQLVPGYHQLAWNGRDAEGASIANGIYIYRLLANNGSSHALQQGRLVKLRRPHHTDAP